MQTEIRGTLAKLLAAENLLVEHKNVPTASFDVANRVLTLPIWDVSNDVYNMLVGHEVGHALYTPNEEIPAGIPQSFVNVTEDARIEKLIKRKFAGIVKDFHKGYEQLNDRDFFEINNIEMEELKLVDRINLHYKIGSYHMIPFNDAETVLRDAVGTIETFEDSIECAKNIFDYMKAEYEAEKDQQQELDLDAFEISMGQGGEGEGEQQEVPAQPSELREEGEENDLEDLSEGKTPQGEFGEGDEPEEGTSRPDVPMPTEVTTQKSFDQSLTDTTSAADDYRAPTYANMPKTFIDKILVDNKLIWDRCEEYWQQRAKDGQIAATERVFNQFCKDSVKDVNYLVKEFEMKKAASSYSRAKESKTGTLDTTKLHQYKFSEDIFKKITMIPDGKNHGLVFLLDWSGSMSREIFDTVKQLINLCQFCRKVGIPFDVYSFVNGDPYGSSQDEIYASKRVMEHKENDIFIDEAFRLMNLLTSGGNIKDFHRQCKNLWAVARYFECHYNYWENEAETPLPVPAFLGLGGTPLNEGLVVMADFLPRWKREHNTEKTHLIVLTDGEAQSTGVCKAPSDYVDRWYSYHLGYNTILRDRQTGKTYSTAKNSGYGITSELIRVIRDRYEWCNVLGFRLCQSRELGHFLSRMNIWDTDPYKKQMRQDKVAVVKTSAYNELYVIALNTDETTEMQVSAEPSKRELRSAFKKSLKGKAANRRLLSSFAGQIA